MQTLTLTIRDDFMPTFMKFIAGFSNDIVVEQKNYLAETSGIKSSCNIDMSLKIADSKKLKDVFEGIITDSKKLRNESKNTSEEDFSRAWGWLHSEDIKLPKISKNNLFFLACSLDYLMQEFHSQSLRLTNDDYREIFHNQNFKYFHEFICKIEEIHRKSMSKIG